MDPHEKAQHAGQPYEHVLGSRDYIRPKPHAPSRIIALLALLLVSISVIFRLPHHCVHALSEKWSPKPLTIEGRVKNILSTTPLIGGYPSRQRSKQQRS